MQEWMTRAEVADLYRTPVATLAQWAWRGYGPRHVRVGRRALYRSAEVVGWIERRAETQADRPREQVGSRA